MPVDIVEPVMKSDAMASVSQMIADSDLYANGWIYQFFERLLYDPEKKEFVHPDVKLFWEYGIHRKRYVEYPWTEETDGETVCRYLSQCLNTQNYLIHYVDEFVWEDIECKPVLLIHDIRDKGQKAVFCCFGLDDDICHVEAEWTKVYETILLPAAKSKKFFCFDMERVEKREEYVFDRYFLKERLKNAALPVIRSKNRLISMNAKQRKCSAKVFCEWFLWFGRRLDYMEKSQMLEDGDADSMQRMCVETAQMLLDKSESKELFLAVKNYNRLCRGLVTVLGKGGCS